MISKILKIYKRIANFLGRINTKIILSIFYLIAIPVFRIIFLLVRLKKDTNSNWKIKEKPYPDEFKYPF